MTSELHSLTKLLAEKTTHSIRSHSLLSWLQ